MIALLLRSLPGIPGALRWLGLRLWCAIVVGHAPIIRFPHCGPSCARCGAYLGTCL